MYRWERGKSSRSCDISYSPTSQCLLAIPQYMLATCLLLLVDWLRRLYAHLWSLAVLKECILQLAIPTYTLRWQAVWGSATLRTARLSFVLYTSCLRCAFAAQSSCTARIRYAFRTARLLFVASTASVRDTALLDLEPIVCLEAARRRIGPG